jgi:molecular chaperone DnaK (HSP70)
MNEISVGIDLGTTNSSISTCWPEGHPRLLRDEEGSGIIPSVVSFTDKGETIIGQKAKQRLLVDLENTFYSIKRFIGRDLRKHEHVWAASQYAFKLESGPNGIPMACTRGKKIPIHQLSGMILRHLVDMAGNSTGQQVKKAVITVPANFNESQRKATKQAGESAGLEVLRIFNEPTAAALAYGLGKTAKETVAIYDFGGGTFDVTILRLEDPIFEVLSTAGDMMLGGDDFDRLILQDMLAQFRDQHGFTPEGDSTLIQRFLFGAERMKCQLSDWIVTAFEDRHVKDAAGKPLSPFHYEMNREKFKKLTVKLGERSLDVCKEALRMSSLATKDISQVVLVGGTTRIPYLRSMVEEFFGRPPLDKIQPDVVVSIGASIQAFSLAGGETVYPATQREMLPQVSTKRLLPKAKGITEFDTEFDEQPDLSDEMEMEDEGPPIGQEEKISLPRAFEDGIQTRVQKHEQKLEETETAVRKSIAPVKPADAQLPAPKTKAATFDLDAAPPAGQSLLDVLKKKGGAPTKTDLRLVKKTEPQFGTAAPPPATPAPSAIDEMDVDSIIASSDVPDIKVVAPPAQEKAAAPPARDRVFPPPSGQDKVTPVRLPVFPPLATPGEPPKAVTPESLNEPYVSRDILQAMKDMHLKEMEEEGEIASVGPAPSPSAPLLLDVTPSTLGVATVGGFVEVIIKKNSPVPVEKGHIFTTSADGQEKVVVRILEGDSPRADENNELGVIELLDVRPAPRGTIKIEVTFDISVDGILEISAKNLETRKEQRSKLTLFGT